MLATYLMFWLALPLTWFLLRVTRLHPRSRRGVQALALAWGLYGLTIALLRQLASATNTDLINTIGLVTPSALTIGLAVWNGLAQHFNPPPEGVGSADSMGLPPQGARPSTIRPAPDRDSR